jgi:hypothetical protein
MENDLLFCSKLMFTNGKIIVYEFMIQFYSYLYFCQSYSWNKDYLINYTLSAWGQKQPAGIKLQYFCQYGDIKKKKKNKVKHISFRHY